MARFFSTRGNATLAPEPSPASLGPSAEVGCASHQPGHRMHYIQQGQALRSPSEPARAVSVDGDRVVVVLDSGTELDWRHHDPARLSATLNRFPSSRTAYPRFHALRVGPYWFNCAEAARFAPCPEDPA